MSDEIHGLLDDAKQAIRLVYGDDHPLMARIDSAMDRMESDETTIDRLRAALRRAALHGVKSEMYSGIESFNLAEWIKAGCEGELPEIESPFVREAWEDHQ